MWGNNRICTPLHLPQQTKTIKMKEPEYPSIYDPRSGTGVYYPWENEYKEKMKIWKEWYNNQNLTPTN
jgi:hypothetical protein